MTKSVQYLVGLATHFVDIVITHVLPLAHPTGPIENFLDHYGLREEDKVLRGINLFNFAINFSKTTLSPAYIDKVMDAGGDLAEGEKVFDEQVEQILHMACVPTSSVELVKIPMSFSGKPEDMKQHTLKEVLKVYLRAFLKCYQGMVVISGGGSL